MLNKIKKNVEKIAVINSKLNFLADISLKTKLICFLSFFSALITIFIGIASYSIAYRMIYKQSLVSAEYLMESIFMKTDQIKSNVNNLSIPLIIDPMIQDTDYNNLQYSDYVIAKRYIESKFLSLVSFNPEISSIYLCISPNIIISPNRYNEDNIENFTEYNEYISAISRISEPNWLGIHKNKFTDTEDFVISFSRAIYSKDTFQAIGVVIINISVDYLNEFLLIGEYENNYNFYIVNRSGEYVYNNNNTTEKKNGFKKFFNSPVDLYEDRGELVYENDGKKYLIKYMADKNSDWIYFLEIPIDYLMRDRIIVRNYILIFLTLFLVIAFAISYLISHYYLKPLLNFTKTIKIIGEGDMSIRTEIMSKNEMGLLSKNFDNMLDKINILIDDLNIEHKLKREAEIETLQAQITPHFLYNTLNSIKCLSRIHGVSVIENMTSNLIDLLRLSISNNSQFISIEEEIEIVKKYLEIQKTRYGNMIRTMYQIDSSLLKYKTLKMIVQPFIENSIKHGIETGTKKGIIRLKVYELENDILFDVFDNGVGMTEEDIQSVLFYNKKRESRFNGIGIKNVDERIKLFFGKQYGISIKSVKGKYTIVTIKIPKTIRGENKNDAI